MNILKSIFVLFVLFSLTGCFMERPTIPRGFNVVYSMVDWFYFDKDGGMSNDILPSGKQELSKGYNTAYFIATTQQNFPLGSLSILMKERVGRDFSINFGYRVIPGADLKLVLNYLPQNDAKKVSESEVGIDNITIDLEQVFRTNVLPFAKQIIMDTIDNESLYSVNTEMLAIGINTKLKGLLSKVLILEHVVDAEGQIVLSGNTISIVDVFDINNINIVPGEMPAIVQTEVQELTDLQATLKSAKEDLKIETVIKSDELLDSARNIKGENDNLAELLLDPKLVKYQKLLQFKEIVTPKLTSDGEVINTETKTQIFFYQRRMTALDMANMVRSAQ